MKQAEKFTLEIIKETINGIPADLPEDIEWDKIYFELEQQAIVSLVYPWTKQHDVSNTDVLKKWYSTTFSQITAWYVLMENQNNLVKLLTNGGYSFAIMKGTANGLLYPKPELRTVGDIDFLVKTEDYEKIYELLVDNGYKLAAAKDDLKHHLELTQNGIIFEMHKRPAGTKRRYSEKNQRLIQYFQDGLNKTETAEIEGYSFPVLSPEHTGIMLLLHTARHLRSGIGIRHLVDWMMYVKTYVTDEFWRNRLEPLAFDADVEILAKVITRCCQLYLGLSDSITWCKDIDREICEDTIDYFMHQGNLGQKVAGKEANIKYFTEVTSVRNFFRRLDRSSKYSFPLGQKCILLRPLGWSYQLFRYFCKSVFYRNDIRKNMLDSRGDSELLRYLKIDFKD